ncbi:NADH dehydrogenase [ubiquinone] 1 alpha subcomplex subunit 1-like [Branchiostoma floridae x Branchiostoma belcheri]
MWYEILPGFGIIVVCLCVPGFVTPRIQKFQNNGKLKRVAKDWNEWWMMSRDYRLTGSHYIGRGLEAIPDKPSKK